MGLMYMRISAPLRTEQLSQVPERICPESKQDGDRGRQRDRSHKPQRTNQGTYDLLGNKLIID